jgi:AsmA protein
MPAAGQPAKGRSRLGRAVRGLGVIVLGILVVIALLVAFPPIGLLKDKLAQMAGASIGRTVTIGGAQLAFRPDALLSLENVTLSNPPAMPGPELFRAESIKAKIRLWPLFKGEADVVSLELVKPELNLQEDGSGAKNWIIEREGQDSTAALVLPRMTAVQKGRVSYASAKTGTQNALDGIDALMAVVPETGVTEVKGQFGLKGERVTAGMALADFRAVAGGKPTNIRAALETGHGAAELAGEAVLSDKSAIAGDLKASTASILDLARWLGADIAPSGEALAASLEGRIKATPADVLFAATNLIVNGNSSRLDGRLGLAGPRPKFEGTIAADRLDLGRLVAARPRLAAQALAPESAGEEIAVAPAWDDLLLELKAIEQGGTARAAAQPEAFSAAPSPGSAWSEQPFNLAALKAFDLDVILTVTDIAYGGLGLKNGRLKAGLSDGHLDSTLEALDMGAGHATGAIKVDSRANPPRADVALSLTDVAADQIMSVISGKPLLSGTSNIDITAAASGQNQSQLASTLEGKAKIRMRAGALRGFDIRLMISEWWRKWTFDIARKTSFERLEAQYDIKKGVLRSSPDLALDGSEVEISSKGDISLPAKRLNQEIRIKVVPPPTSFPIPVRISGAWSQPSIGVDWGGLFSSTEALGGPQGVAPSAEPPPLAVQAAIRRVLASDIDQSILNDQGKAILRSLLPEESAPPATPPSGNSATPQ